ncbi:MAG: hypothetical protein VB855_12150, partial [Pirellulaceae bacterium]
MNPLLAQVSVAKGLFCSAIKPNNSVVPDSARGAVWITMGDITRPLLSRVLSWQEVFFHIWVHRSLPVQWRCCCLSL